jgi:hypothetical protein
VRGRLDSAEEGRGNGVGLPRVPFRGLLAVGSGGRGNGCPGELPAWERDGAARFAPVGAKGRAMESGEGGSSAAAAVNVATADGDIVVRVREQA